MCVIGEIQRNLRVRYVPKGILISLLSCAVYVTGILMEQISLECSGIVKFQVGWAMFQDMWHSQEKWEPLVQAVVVTPMDSLCLGQLRFLM